jgi:hypothetical protein
MLKCERFVIGKSETTSGVPDLLVRKKTINYIAEKIVLADLFRHCTTKQTKSKCNKPKTETMRSDFQKQLMTLCSANIRLGW